MAKDYEVDDGRVVMTASAWNNVYEQAEKCFKEVEICGWFLCSSDSRMTDLYNLQKSHCENFRSQNQILFVYDGNREEENIYWFDTQGAHRLHGYYIYYERNEQMQEYMISQEPIRKTEFAVAPAARGISDEATRQFRNVMEGKQEKEQTKPESSGISKMLRTVSVAALLCGAGFGLAAWYKYDGMEGIREVASVLTGGNQAETNFHPDGERLKETGQAVVREVAGEVKPTESGAVQETEGDVSQENGSAQGGSGAALPAAGEASTEAATAPETKEIQTQPQETQATKAAPAAAEEKAYQEYTVKSGDRLSVICKEFYGDGNASLVEEVCKFNGMANANLIYEGQILKLPERD